ncbi:MAG: ornithine cyclodeaminase family protein [Sulfitobacter sp. SK025]|nr:MAG: ornithine cyclodeaminase family protein [Sulfitobacter sp. SK025]
MKVFDSKATADRLPYSNLIPALRQMFIDGCTVPRRHNHIISDGEAGPDTLLIMPAWQEGRYLGIKHVTIFPKNSLRGMPGLYSTYTLFNADNGTPLSIIDGDQITVRRTAAASALAATYLAREDASQLAIVGAGNVASELAPAYATIRPIRKVWIWDKFTHKADALAHKLRQDGFDAHSSTDLQSVVVTADIVTCATLSRAPLILREWLKSGTHLDLIGSFLPTMREADDATFVDTSVFVDTTEALEKSGDLLSPIKIGLLDPSRVLSTLEGLCRQSHPGRTFSDEITVYKAVGTASEDLAAALLVYESNIQ